ncbi:MAG: class I SAM-dependent methyltransferase [Clostridiales bacterium]|nr:class I SAM-dependent methyltransferase [Clostridiales bacterium]
MPRHDFERWRFPLRKENNRTLFNLIAPVYGLFYNRQKRRYAEVVRNAAPALDLTAYQSILDVGCGTGALCSVLSASGLSVTGVDSAEKMLAYARRQPENREIQFLQANVTQRLPFDDKRFDVSIASYVAHGMPKEERIKLYAEMSRVTRTAVVIFDYNQKRAFLTSLVEWLERGDYFRFIKSAESEMKNCVSEMSDCFSSVVVVDVGERASWYICTPA